jgi:type VI secretion system protein ImpL
MPCPAPLPATPGKSSSQGAIREASNRELQSTDWVLKTAAKDDLTLEGSPEQIQKTLIDLYKADYAREWAKFVQGVTIADLNGFEASVQAMNRLGDPQASPIAKVLKTVYERPPGTTRPRRASTGKLKRGLLGWFREVVLRQAPSDARQLADAAGPLPWVAPAAGPVGREFAGVARLVGIKEKDASLMTGYLDALSKLRSRLNQLKNQGDPGPGAKQLMQQTLEGSGSELADALKYVDEQMLTGMTDAQKQMLRPLLVRPLVQTFAMIVLPSESEINKTWQAQVVEPFQRHPGRQISLRRRRPDAGDAGEIGQVFGPEGAVAKFVATTMGPLVVRRGDVLQPHLGRHRHHPGAPGGERLPRLDRAAVRQWRGFRQRPADGVPAAADDRARRHRIHDRDRRPAAALPEHAAGLGQHGPSGAAGGQRGQDQRRHFRRPHRGAVQRAGRVRPAEADRGRLPKSWRRHTHELRWSSRQRLGGGDAEAGQQRQRPAPATPRPAAASSGLRLPDSVVGRAAAAGAGSPQLAGAAQ